MRARVVPREPDEHGGQNDGQVVGVFLVQARVLEAVGRERVDGIGELRRRLAERSEVERGAAGAFGRCAQHCCAVDPLEQRDRLVVSGIGVGLGELGIQAVVDDVVHEPRADVAVHARLVESAVGAVERLERLERLCARLGADTHEQLIDVHVGERRRDIFDLAAPHVAAPGEVAAQLAVVHRAIGRVIRDELPDEGGMVLEVLQELGLLEEEPRLGPGAPLRRDLHLPELLDGLGHKAVHLRAAADDGLVAVSPRRGEGAALAQTRVGEQLLQDLVDVGHCHLLRRRPGFRESYVIAAAPASAPEPAPTRRDDPRAQKPAPGYV